MFLFAKLILFFIVIMYINFKSGIETWFGEEKIFMGVQMSSIQYIVNGALIGLGVLSLM